jgi:hypothetical protein
MKKLLILQDHLLPAHSEGRPFKAFLVQTDKKDVGFEFEGAARQKRTKTKERLQNRFAGKESLANAQMRRKDFETENSYICEHSRRPEAMQIQAKQTILGKDIPKKQAQTTGVGKPISSTVSSRRGRPFSAY